MGPLAWARMARFIPTRPRASPDIPGKDMAARAGPEIAAERVGPAPNFPRLTTSFRVEMLIHARLILLLYSPI
jgi:hypothetical protein